jgi:hypothetical protein
MKFLLVFSTLAIYVLLPGISISKSRTNPWIKLKKSSSMSYSLSKTKVSPSRYIITHGQYGITSGQIFDISTGKSHRLPVLKKAIGFDLPPKLGNLISLKRRKAELKGIAWSWGSGKVVYYDGIKGIAGFWVTKVVSRKITKGAPLCPCGSISVLEKRDHRYHCYCKGYRKPLPVQSYIKKEHSQYYFHIDVRKNRVLWKSFIGKGRYSFIGVKKGDFLYAGLRRYENSKKIYKTSGGIVRLNMSTHKIDWNKSLNFPQRKNIQGPYSIQYRASLDFNLFFIWEFDEKLRNSNRGRLRKPFPVAYVVNKRKRSSFKFEAPVEIWTSVFDKKGEYLYVNSYQKGEITKVNLKTNLVKTIKRVKRTFHSAISSDSKYLYNFHLKGITIYSVQSFKKVKFISKRSYLGKENTTSGVWYNLNGGKDVLLGIWKKRKISPSGHINPSYPFSIYQIK